MSLACCFAGLDSFTFKANDGTVDSAPATVSITVNAVDHYWNRIDGALFGLGRNGRALAAEADPVELVGRLRERGERDPGVRTAAERNLSKRRAHGQGQHDREKQVPFHLVVLSCCENTIGDLRYHPNFACANHALSFT